MWINPNKNCTTTILGKKSPNKLRKKRMWEDIEMELSFKIYGEKSELKKDRPIERKKGDCKWCKNWRN